MKEAQEDADVLLVSKKEGTYPENPPVTTLCPELPWPPFSTEAEHGTCQVCGDIYLGGLGIGEVGEKRQTFPLKPNRS